MAEVIPFPRARFRSKGFPRWLPEARRWYGALRGPVRRRRRSAGSSPECTDGPVVRCARALRISIRSRARLAPLHPPRGGTELSRPRHRSTRASREPGDRRQPVSDSRAENPNGRFGCRFPIEDATRSARPSVSTTLLTSRSVRAPAGRASSGSRATGASWLAGSPSATRTTEPCFSVHRGKRPILLAWPPAPGSPRRSSSPAASTSGRPQPHSPAASCAVTKDSAPLHLAAALGTPSVSLFGPTDPARVGPRAPVTPSSAETSSTASAATNDSCPARRTFMPTGHFARKRIGRHHLGYSIPEGRTPRSSSPSFSMSSCSLSERARSSSERSRADGARRGTTSTGECFSLLPRRVRPAKCLWVHGVSAGEILSARKLVESFVETHPGWRSTSPRRRPSGLEAARRRYSNVTVFSFPFDFSYLVDRAFRRVRPDLVLIVEHDIWPAFLAARRNAAFRSHSSTLAARSDRFAAAS